MPCTSTTTPVTEAEIQAPAEVGKRGVEENQLVLAGADSMVNDEICSEELEGRLARKDDPVASYDVDVENPFGPWMLVKRPIRRKSMPKPQEGNYSNYLSNHQKAAGMVPTGSRFDSLNVSDDINVNKENAQAGSSEIQNRMKDPLLPKPTNSLKKKAQFEKPSSSKPKPSKALSIQGRPSVAREKDGTPANGKRSSLPTPISSDPTPPVSRSATGRRVTEEERAILHRLSYIQNNEYNQFMADKSKSSVLEEFVVHPSEETKQFVLAQLRKKGSQQIDLGPANDGIVQTSVDDVMMVEEVTPTEAC
ncbi:hypothetical protein RIF29_18940 [Crotalaria pallida]|uniref:Uncharacterized protein n=1 Tax=Crotalaria pallida TaxID=3830 RepID=A0AAN9EYH6_CROPI